jgi:hypothetical protein
VMSAGIAAVHVVRFSFSFAASAASGTSRSPLQRCQSFGV